MHQGGIMQLLDKVTDLPVAVRKLGLTTTVGLARSHFEEMLWQNASYRLRSVRPRGYSFPLYYRVHSSDINVLQQVFLRGEYDCVSQETNVEFIVDCGANIGCTSARRHFFLANIRNPRSWL